MDSLSQIVLGASVAEAVAGKKLGNKAILWGAIAGTIPDLDFLTGRFLSVTQQIAFHRSITHSILFSILGALLFAFLLRKFLKKSEMTFLNWFNLFFLGFLTHSLLDCFTTWGTQLFYPLPYRVAIKSIFVIDPLYTLPFLICVLVAMFFHQNNPKRSKWNYIGLVISTLYLCLTLVNKWNIEQTFSKAFQKQIGAFQNIQTRPMALNNILWTANIEVEKGYYLGYYSLLDTSDRISFFFIPKNHELLKEIKQDKEVQALIKISEGFYTIQKNEQGLIFNDLRFGQLLGWQNGTGDFTFSYQLIVHPNHVEVQERKKKKRDGKELLRQIWERMQGQ
ncbi:MAG: metal-dependent hydrolase [Cytophagales bacterium]|nr:metal-dependent hydrolase [Cytophagales bacterium]